MNTYKIEKTHAGASLAPLDSVCFDRGILFVDGTITEETATQFIQNGILLAAKDTPITIIINTNGGDLQAGLNIYDFITSMKDVTTIAVKAYSMGAVLFVAGSRRIMLPHSQLMIHEPLIQSDLSGSCSSVEAISNVLKAKREQMAQLFAAHTGRPAGDFHSVMSKDTYFNAEEAVAFGLCDTISNWNAILQAAQM